MNESLKLKRLALLIYLLCGLDVILGLVQCITVVIHYFLRHTPTPQWVWLSALAHPILLWGVYQLIMQIKQIHAARKTASP